MNRSFPWAAWSILAASVIASYAYGVQTNDGVGMFGAMTSIMLIVAIFCPVTRVGLALVGTFCAGATIFAAGAKAGITWPAVACLVYFAALAAVSYAAMKLVDLRETRMEDERFTARREARRAAA